MPRAGSSRISIPPCRDEVLLTEAKGAHAVFDQKIVWYGSINLLSFGRSEESIMRLENPGIADELLGSIQK